MVASLVAAVLALTVLTLVPGPDVAVVTRVALAHGRAAAIRTSVGVVCGLATWAVLTAAGLAAVLAASATAYAVVKVAGAAYLVALGLVTLARAGRHHADRPAPPPGRAARQPWRVGFASNLLNPKIAVFYTGLLPQLVPAGAPHTVTLLGLVAAHVVITIAWLTGYVALVTRASAALTRPAVRRALDRLTGLVLVGFGVRIAVTRGH
ncbi:MAG TPA: LysE family translocator [Mycobacteriales bacterium]|nr:LysE family translocator [Mycobacteriales bacterium]